ncbi:hypothetical protein ACLOJK_023970 [Asimina triloba]
MAAQREFGLKPNKQLQSPSVSAAHGNPDLGSSMADPRPAGSSNIFRQQAPSAGSSLQSSESMADFTNGGTQPCQDSNPLVTTSSMPMSQFHLLKGSKTLGSNAYGVHP